MSSVDQRVVQMQFDNAQFERETRASMDTITKLTKKLDLLGSKGGALDNFSMTSAANSMSNFGEAISNVSARFSKLDAVAFGFLSNFGANLESKVSAFVKSLSIDQVSAGWTKYAQKTSAVQTIMSATAAQFENTEQQMSYVNDQLSKLNWFTDETSYNFVDMVDNIGKFTNNNIPLDKAVISMEGIATWAAASGANAQQASRAMYNLSQSLGMGSVKLMDWMSIENAQMATVEFKETVMETAAELGVLKKAEDGTFKTLKNSEVTVENFRNTLSEGWFTSDVLTGALQQYGGFTEKLNAAYEETGLTTSRLLSSLEDYENGTLDMSELLNKTGTSAERLNEIFTELSDSEYDLGKKAFKAAQESKTFADAVNATMDAVSTGWMNTFELIFGDYEEAKQLWTDVTEVLYDTFASSGEVRNALLSQWKDLGGRDILLTSFWNTLDAIEKIITPIKEAFRDIFPAITADRLVQLTAKLWAFSRQLFLSDTTLANLKKTFKGIFAIFDIGKTAVGALWNAFKPIGDIFKTVASNLLGIAGNIGDYIVKINETIKENKFFETSLKFINMTLDKVSDGVSYFFDLLNSKKKNAGEFYENLKTNFTKLKNSVGDTLADLVSRLGLFGSTADAVKNTFSNLGPKIKSGLAGFFDAVKDVFSNADFGKLGDILNTGILASILVGISKFTNNLSSPIKSFSDLIDKLKDGASGIGGIFDNLSEILGGFQTKIKADALKKIAVSVAILAGSLIVLSFVDSDKMSTSLLGLAGIMGLLVGFMAALKAVTTDFKSRGLSAISTNIIKLSAGILILALALTKIGKLSLADVGKGLLGIGVLLGMILAFSVLAQNVSRGSGRGLKVISQNLFGIAVSILLLTAPIKILGQMDSDALKQGLLSVGALLVGIGLFMKIVNGVKIKGNGLSLVLIAASMLIFTSSIKKLGQDLNPNELKQAGIALGSLLGILAVFLLALNTCKRIGKSAGALVAVSVAVLLLTGAVAALASIEDAEAAYRAVLIIAAALGAMVLALKFAKGGLGAAAALAILSVSLLALIPTFLILGNLKWEQLGKGFAAIAGSILVLGLAAKLLKPTIPAMIGLAAALLLFGAGVSLIGVGLVSISVGLTSLAASMAASGLTIVTGITAILTAIIGLIPAVAIALVDGVVDFVAALGKNVPRIIEAVVAIGIGILNAIRAIIPLMIDVGFEILMSLLSGISNNIGAIIGTVAEIIVAILDGLATYAPILIDSGMSLAISLINGLADGLRGNTPDFLAAIRNLGSSAIEALLSVFQDLIDIIFGNTGVGKTISGWLEGAKESVRGALAPESFMAAGEEAAASYGVGLSNGTEDVEASINGLSETALNGAEQLTTSALTGTDTFVEEFAGYAGTSADEFIETLEAMAPEAETAGDTFINSALSGANNSQEEFTSAGKNAGLGFINGILLRRTEVYNAGYSIGQSAAAGMQDALDEHSPSKLTKKYGVFASEGLIIGLVSKKNAAYDAGSDIGSTAAKGMSMALHAMSDQVQNGIDFEPTIRPVIDLSDIDRKANRINAMFTGAYAIRAQNEFQPNLQYSQDASDLDQDASALKTNQGVTFNQYNYSPKALTRLEIYRQTKNQLSMMKGVVKNS